MEMENKIEQWNVNVSSLFSRILYIILWIFAFIIVFYNYGKNNISLASSFKNATMYLEDKSKELFYKIWLSMKMKGDAIKINYNDYNILDKSLDIDNF